MSVSDKAFFTGRPGREGGAGLTRGRKILEMIPVLIARTSELAGATDIVVEMGVDDYNAASQASPHGGLGTCLMLPLDGSRMVEVRPRENSEPDRLYVFRRGDAPS